MKKIIKAFAFVIATLAALGASAQSIVGQWEQYAVYTGMPDYMAKARDGRLYYLVGTRLFSMEADGEFVDWAQRLNSTEVNVIYYTPIGKYLAVGYTDGNIDLIYDGDDYPVNMSDIKDASINSTKTVRCFEHHDGRLYVGTAFGVVSYDVDKHVVLQSGIYDQSVTTIATIGDYLIIRIASQAYLAPLSGKINRLSEFTKDTGEHSAVIKEARRLGDNYVFESGYSWYRISQYDPATGIVKTRSQWSDLGTMPWYSQNSDGSLYVHNAGYSNVYQISTEGSRTQVATLPSALTSDGIALCDGVGKAWAGGSDGIGLFSFDMDGGMTTYQSKSVPSGAMDLLETSLMAASKDGEYVYFSNTAVWPGVNSSGSSISIKADQLHNGTFKDYSHASVKYHNCIAVDPDDPEILWVATRSNGLFALKNGEIVVQYTAVNMGMNNSKAKIIYGMSIDADGNLWMQSWNNEDSGTYSGGIYFLPSAKRKQCTGLTSSDFYRYDMNEDVYVNLRGTVLVCEHSDLVIASSYESGNQFVVINRKGTPNNPADDSVNLYPCTSVAFSDGGTVDIGRVWSIAEDMNGNVWIAGEHCLSVIEYANVANALNGELIVSRPKVPRNDGTNYADYLLDGVVVYDISVDGMNRKWLGTVNGLYCVNEDGSEILEHLDSNNSMLPTNSVRGVYADPNTNRIYVATVYGAMCYSSTSLPGNASYDNVYAYPNPVKPDFTGWITVAGLMDGSLVKIADIAGNVVHSGRSEGGMYVWDGCNSSGSRVKSGVYVVYASQNSDGTSAAVTKILIMN